jgi:hypothetical protein
MLQVAQSTGIIRGVSPTPTAPPLTHNMYVDDLVLFGRAVEDEIVGLSHIMEAFGENLNKNTT